jgi:hypothetical protein
MVRVKTLSDKELTGLIGLLAKIEANAEYPILMSDLWGEISDRLQQRQIKFDEEKKDFPLTIEKNFEDEDPPLPIINEEKPKRVLQSELEQLEGERRLREKWKQRGIDFPG